ncbi:MAG: 4-(cytidine 5'-diphospho)-2-C-methyl-D-erythritol kinase [Erysipelotrichaceae bacterium]
MKIYCYAKINLGLDIIERMANGFHLLDMIMTPINLYDTLDIVPNELDHDVLSFTDPSINIGNNNTILNSLALMRSTFNIQQHFSIVCDKRIPMQAGLGGGSADGAGIINFINDYYKLGLSLEELIVIGKKIGADVPFCIINHCSRVKGIGEEIKPFNIVPMGIILIKDSEGVSTAQAFKQCNLTTCDHPNMNSLQTSLAQHNYEQASLLSANSLEESSFKLVQNIAIIKNELKEMGFYYTLMSGSGSSVYAISEDYAKLNAAATKLKEKYEYVYVTSILNEVRYDRKY